MKKVVKAKISKLTYLVAILLFVLVGCGRNDYDYSGYTHDTYGSEQNTQIEDTVESSEEQFTTNVEPQQEYDVESKKVEQKPYVNPPIIEQKPIKPMPPRPVALSVYQSRKATPLAIYDLKAKVLMGRLITSEIFADALYAWANAGNFFAPAKRPRTRSAAEKVIEDYEEMMDDEYYFVRVTKFRAPETAKKGAYYTWFFAASPDVETGKERKMPAETAAVFKMGKANYLMPGAPGEGGEWIISIPRSKVQSLFGYWNESVKLQLGILELDMNEIQYKNGSKIRVDKACTPIGIYYFEYSFYDLDEGDVDTRTFRTKTASGRTDAVMEVRFWKGDWRTNNR